MAKPLTYHQDSRKSLLPRPPESSWVWDNQHDQPDTDIVGVIAVSQEAKKNVGGLLHSQANSFPSSHRKFAPFITDPDGSVNPEIQAQLAWLGGQILGMSQLEITGSEALGAAFNLEVTNPSPGVYQILLTYPTITDGVDGVDGEDGIDGVDGSDAPATIVRSDPAGFGNMEQSIAGAGYTDIANSDYVRRGGEFEMYGGLEIYPTSDEVLLTMKGVGSPYQTNKILRVQNASGVDVAWVNPRGDGTFTGHQAGVNAIALTLLAGGILIDNQYRLYYKTPAGALTNSQYVNSSGDFTIDAALQFVWKRSDSQMMKLSDGVWTLQSFLTNGRTMAIIRGGTDQSANVLFNILQNGGSELFKVHPTGKVEAFYYDATSASVVDSLTLDHESSGTPAANFGEALRFKGKSSTTASQNMARLRSEWSDATHATRKAEVVLSAYDTSEREVLRGGTDGAVPKVAVLGATPSARIDMGAVDAAGNEAAYFCLLALEQFGFITGTFTEGTAPEIPEAVILLTRCQYATATARFMFHHAFKPAADYIAEDLGVYAIEDRQNDLRARIDVTPSNWLQYGDAGWTFYEWLDYGNDADPPGYAAHLVLMEAYFETQVAEMLYCLMDDNGILTEADFGTLMILAEEHSSFSDTTMMFYRFIQAWDNVNMAQFIASAAHSSYVYGVDCELFECESWLVTLTFTDDDWSESVTLHTGSYGAGGYFATAGNTVMIDVPYRITSAQMTCRQDDDDPPVEIRIIDINTSVSTDYVEHSGSNDVDWYGDAVDGLRFIVEAGTDAVRIIRIELQGLGTAPVPD